MTSCGDRRLVDLAAKLHSKSDGAIARANATINGTLSDPDKAKTQIEELLNSVFSGSKQGDKEVLYRLELLKKLVSSDVSKVAVEVLSIPNNFDKLVEQSNRWEGDLQEIANSVVEIVMPHCQTIVEPEPERNYGEFESEAIDMEIEDTQNTIIESADAATDDNYNQHELDENDMWRFPAVLLTASDAEHLRLLELGLSGSQSVAIQCLGHMMAGTFADFPPQILLQPAGAGVRRALLNLLHPNESTSDRRVEIEALRTLAEWLLRLNGAVRDVRNPEYQVCNPGTTSPSSTCYPSSTAVSGARGLSLCSVAVEIFERCAILLRDPQLIWHALACLDICRVFLGTRSLCAPTVKCLDILCDAVLYHSNGSKPAAKGKDKHKYKAALWGLTLTIIESYCGSAEELANSGLVSSDSPISVALADLVTDGPCTVVVGGSGLKERALPYATAITPEIVAEGHYAPRAFGSCEFCRRMAKQNHKYDENSPPQPIQNHDVAACGHDWHADADADGEKLYVWKKEIGLILEGLLYVNESTVVSAVATCVQGILCTFAHSVPADASLRHGVDEDMDTADLVISSLLSLIVHPRSIVRAATLEAIASVSHSHSHPSSSAIASLFLNEEFLSHIAVFGLSEAGGAGVYAVKIIKATVFGGNERSKRRAIRRIASVLQGYIGEDDVIGPACGELLSMLEGVYDNRMVERPDDREIRRRSESEEVRHDRFEGEEDEGDDGEDGQESFVIEDDDDDDVDIDKFEDYETGNNENEEGYQYQNRDRDQEREESGAVRVAIMVRALYHRIPQVRKWASHWVRQWLGLGELGNVDLEHLKAQSENIRCLYDPMVFGLSEAIGSSSVNKSEKQPKTNDLVKVFFDTNLDTNVRAAALDTIVRSPQIDHKLASDQQFIDSVVSAIVCVGENDNDKKLRDSAVAVLSRYILAHNPSALAPPASFVPAPGNLVQHLLVLTMAYLDKRNVRVDASVALALLFFNGAGCVEHLMSTDTDSADTDADVFKLPSHVFVHYTFPKSMKIQSVDYSSSSPYTGMCPTRHATVDRMVEAARVQADAGTQGDDDFADIECGVDVIRAAVGAVASAKSRDPSSLIAALNTLTSVLWRTSMLPEHYVALEGWLKPLLGYNFNANVNVSDDGNALCAVIRTMTVILKKYGTQSIQKEDLVSKLCSWVGKLKHVLSDHSISIDDGNSLLLNAGIQLASVLCRTFPKQSIPVLRENGWVSLLARVLAAENESSHDYHLRSILMCIESMISSHVWWCAPGHRNGNGIENVDTRAREARSLMGPLFTTLARYFEAITISSSFVFCDIVTSICMSLSAWGIGDYSSLTVDWVQANLIEWLKPVSTNRSSAAVAAGVAQCGASLGDKMSWSSENRATAKTTLDACATWLLDRSLCYAVRTAACMGVAAAAAVHTHNSDLLSSGCGFLDLMGITPHLSSLLSEPRATPSFLYAVCRLLCVVAASDPNPNQLHAVLVENEMWPLIIDSIDINSLKRRWQQGVGRWGPGPSGTFTAGDLEAWSGGIEEDSAMQCSAEASNIVRICVTGGGAGTAMYLLHKTRVAAALASVLGHGVGIGSVFAHTSAAKATTAILSVDQGSVYDIALEAMWSVPSLGNALAHASEGYGTGTEQSLRDVRLAVCNLVSLLLPPMDDSIDSDVAESRLKHRSQSLDEQGAGGVLCRIASFEMVERNGTRAYGRMMSRLLATSAGGRKAALETGLVERIVKRMRQSGESALNTGDTSNLRDIAIAGRILACMLRDCDADGYESKISEIPVAAAIIWPILIDVGRDCEVALIEVLGACIAAITSSQAAAISASRPPSGYGPRHTLVHLVSSLVVARLNKSGQYIDVECRIRSLALRLLSAAAQYTPGRSAVLRTRVVPAISEQLCEPIPSIRPSRVEQERNAEWHSDMLLFLSSLVCAGGGEDGKAARDAVLRNAGLFETICYTVENSSDDNECEAATLLLRSTAIANPTAPQLSKPMAIRALLTAVRHPSILISEHSAAALATLARSSKRAVALLRGDKTFVDTIPHALKYWAQVQARCFPVSEPDTPPADGAMPLSTPIRPGYASRVEEEEKEEYGEEEEEVYVSLTTNRQCGSLKETISALEEVAKRIKSK